MLGTGKSTVEILIAAKDRTKAAFTKVNAQMTTMKGGAGRLGGAMNTLKGGISSATSSLGSLGTALGPLGIAVAAAAVVMATLGGAAFKASLEFEKAFATLRVGTGATGESLKGFEEDFRAVFGDIPRTAAAISQALTTMTTATGASGTVLQDLTKNIMEASRMLGEEGAGNAKAFGEAMKQWQIPAASGVGLMEQFFKIAQDTNIGFGELTGAMNAYGPVLQNAGFTAAESAELFGRLEGSGIAVSRVMPGLNAAFRKWAEEGIRGKVALEGTIGAIKTAETNMEALTIATDIFGAEGAQRMTTAVRNGTFELSSLGEMLEGTEGIIMKTSEATLTFGDKWTLLKNKVTEAIAPIGNVIKNILGNAIEGLSAQFNLLQTVISTVMNIFKGFFDAVNSVVSSALAPLVSKVEELRNKFKEGSEKLTIFSDIITIAAAGAKWLGEKIGILLKMALTPLVDKLKDGIEMLTEFYNKLGPIKDAIGWVGAGIHNFAESLRATKPQIEEVEAALEKLAEEGPKAPQAIADAWAIAVKAFQDGSGAYKDAVTEINKEVEALKEEWKTATDERKAQIDKTIILIHEESEAVEAQNKVYDDHFAALINDTDKVIEKTKEFIVTIGDTTIEFKGAAAEVVKNADAYEKLQRAAQTLIDLDWSVFSEFEASLPNIEAGIGDMESSFVGLKGILEVNIVELENVKQAVMDISEIAAPFLEVGFLDGIKAIGSFASTLKDASSAIGDFSSLQDVSIEGCINFSMHVRDMVTALEILESQMEDLVPVFGNMDSLITDIADAFLYSSGKAEVFATDFDSVLKSAYSTLGAAGISFEEFSKIVEKAMDTGKLEYWDEKYNRWRTDTINGAEDVKDAISTAMIRSGTAILRQGGIIKDWGEINADTLRSATRSLRDYVKETYGASITYDEAFKVMSMSAEEQLEWHDKLMRSDAALTFQMDKQTNALKAQTEQLSKITDALQPYLNFMRILNELAALSTFSTDQLNNGLNSIKDTLINLGAALSTFDLQSVMESLFGTKTTEGGFTGGTAKAFSDTMSAYQTQFEIFKNGATTITELVSTILSLTAALKDMRDMTVLSVRDIDEALKNIPVFLDGFVDALALNMSAIKQSLKELDVEWQKHAEEMKATMPSYEDSTAQIGKLVGSLLSLNSALKQVAEMGTISGAEFDAGFKSLMVSISNFAVSLAKNVDDLIDSLSKLSYVWNENKATLVPLMDTFLTVTYSFWEISNNANAMAESFRDLEKNLGTLEKGFKSLIDFINQVVESTKEFYTTETAAELATFIADVGKVIDAFVDLEQDLKEAMRKVEKAIDDAVNNMHKEVSTLGDLPKSAYTWGVNTMQSYINGINSKTEALAAAVAAQAGVVEEYLGASSPTKSGPLSHLDEWPRNLVQSYSAGIEAEMHTLNHSFAALTPTMGAAGPASSTKSVTINLTQNIGNRSDADYSVAQLRREIIRHEVM